MKLLGITVSLLAASGGQAFAPSNSKVSRSQLNAETLEGWKVNGNIKPVNNFILIKKAEVQKESESGIIFSKSVGWVFIDFYIVLFTILLVEFRLDYISRFINIHFHCRFSFLTISLGMHPFWTSFEYAFDPKHLRLMLSKRKGKSYL